MIAKDNMLSFIEIKMKNVLVVFITACFVFISSYLSFTLSFEAGIFVSALLLEFFSRFFLKNNNGIW